jgi:hypothetical protein
VRNGICVAMSFFVCVKKYEREIKEGEGGGAAGEEAAARDGAQLYIYLGHVDFFVNADFMRVNALRKKIKSRLAAEIV